MIHDFRDFMNQVKWLCWLESLDPVFFFNFFLIILLIIDNSGRAK